MVAGVDDGFGKGLGGIGGGMVVVVMFVAFYLMRDDRVADFFVKISSLTFKVGSQGTIFFWTPG